jgi:hypothetical protein
LTQLFCASNQLTSLDVSQNTALAHFWCGFNQLVSLDVRNGNNANITFNARGNIDLSCISVDDEDADHSGWNIDAGVSFSNDCDLPVISNIELNPDSPAELSYGERVNITFSYTKLDGDVHIWARPFNDGSIASGYSAHPSPLYTINTGNVVGFFYFVGDADVDQIRVQIVDLTNVVLFEQFIDVEFKWVDAAACPPSLVYPLIGEVMDNGCTDQSDQIIWDFDWEDCAGAARYHLYVISESASIPFIDDHTISESNFTVNTTAFTTNLFGWKWKVRAEVNNVWGPWSEERSFDVEPVDTDCPSIGFSASSFGEGSSIVDGNITLYPNPVVDYMQVVHADKSVPVKDMSVLVYDNSGGTLQTDVSYMESSVNHGLVVDMTQLPAGYYILHVNDLRVVKVIRIQKD